MREYIWLVEAEIAPTRSAGGRLDEGESPAPRQNVDRPIAVISGVSTTPTLLMVHVDQLNRPVQMTDGSGSVVWSALYSPFGGAYTLSGSETLNARFPGQWFQMEAGLHYNWHRHYDPTLGRYTQPDPLGFVDGPSVFAYAGGSPEQKVDPKGLWPSDTDTQWKCVNLMAATTFFCKPFLFSEETRCFIWDSCEVLKRKMNRIQLCIKFQCLLSTICFESDGTHNERYCQESDAMWNCKELAWKKKCDQCSSK